MARVTVEDCLEKVPNRYALVVLAVHRARQLKMREFQSEDIVPPLVRSKNKEIVTALREIAAGGVYFEKDPLEEYYEKKDPLF